LRIYINQANHHPISIQTEALDTNNRSHSLLLKGLRKRQMLRLLGFFCEIGEGELKRNASKHHLEPLAMSDTLSIPCKTGLVHLPRNFSQAAVINVFIMQQLCT